MCTLLYALTQTKIIQICKILFRDLIMHLLDVLCKEQMRLQVQDIGGWVRFTETMHELYAHLAEMIGKLNSYILQY